MNKRKMAFIAISICVPIMLIKTWLLDDSYEFPWLVWVPIVAILAWSAWQLRANPDPNAKTFDFDPRRGFLFFCLGFVAFPFMLMIDAIFGTEVSLQGAALFTVGASIFIGIIGTFTEHIGV